MTILIAGDPINGGSVWESNPPDTLVTRHTGFEDQADHQTRTTPVQGHHDLTRTAMTGQVRGDTDQDLKT